MSRRPIEHALAAWIHAGPNFPSCAVEIDERYFGIEGPLGRSRELFGDRRPTTPELTAMVEHAVIDVEPLTVDIPTLTQAIDLVMVRVGRVLDEFEEAAS
jgi:hypothetical protein